MAPLTVTGDDTGNRRCVWFEAPVNVTGPNKPTEYARCNHKLIREFQYEQKGYQFDGHREYPSGLLGTGKHPPIKGEKIVEKLSELHTLLLFHFFTEPGYDILDRFTFATIGRKH